ncbi:GNAT family N-acetyltransferase [Solitalea lacus]|uniref:GNAT family N-acetyltransferase n=1 Tax=Solitalea lacus TaxID=2911172 RepID=UPI001ED9E430|nr:GNAT family protein [Solitalea lacus]UKJ08161.1 GNAT family N-acetyltransferase [Solitalea lacus]
MLIKLRQFELRPWQKDDAVSLAENANNKAIWDNLRDSFPYPYTIKDAEEWIAKNELINPATNMAIVINGAAVGSIGVCLKEDVARINAEIGFWLGEKYWNRSIMTDAVTAFIDYVFDNFDIVRIYAEVFEYNQASISVLKKAGFIEEAILRFSIIKNDEIMDAYVLSILKD